MITETKSLLYCIYNNQKNIDRYVNIYYKGATSKIGRKKRLYKIEKFYEAYNAEMDKWHLKNKRDLLCSKKNWYNDVLDEKTIAHNNAVLAETSIHTAYEITSKYLYIIQGLAEGII